MTEEKNKINPYIVVIVVLLLVIAGLLYNQWGNGILPASVEESSKEFKEDNGQDTQSKNVDVKVTEEDLFIGNEGAPVTIVEYYSYLCGYCEKFDSETKPQLVKDYVEKGKVKFVFRPYPPYELGTAVLCANDQGKFLEYHNALFEKAQSIQKVEDLITIAGETGLDKTSFDQCFNSQKYLERAQALHQMGDKTFEEAGVTAERRGTPAFFINGEMLIGAQPYDSFVKVIESKLNE